MWRYSAATFAARTPRRGAREPSRGCSRWQWVSESHGHECGASSTYRAPTRRRVGARSRVFQMSRLSATAPPQVRSGDHHAHGDDPAHLARRCPAAVPQAGAAPGQRLSASLHLAQRPRTRRLLACPSAVALLAMGAVARRAPGDIALCEVTHHCESDKLLAARVGVALTDGRRGAPRSAEAARSCWDCASRQEDRAHRLITSSRPPSRSASSCDLLLRIGAVESPLSGHVESAPRVRAAPSFPGSTSRELMATAVFPSASASSARRSASKRAS